MYSFCFYSIILQINNKEAFLLFQFSFVGISTGFVYFHRTDFLSHQNISLIVLHLPPRITAIRSIPFLIQEIFLGIHNFHQNAPCPNETNSLYFICIRIFFFLQKFYHFSIMIDEIYPCIGIDLFVSFSFSAIFGNDNWKL